MDSVLPSEHICSMDNCHLAMCSGEKKKSHLLSELRASSTTSGRNLSQFVCSFWSTEQYS